MRGDTEEDKSMAHELFETFESQSQPLALSGGSQDDESLCFIYEERREFISS